MIQANQWYNIAKTSTIPSSTGVRLDFSTFQIEFSATVDWGNAIITLISSNVTEDVKVGLRIRNAANAFYIDVRTSVTSESSLSVYLYENNFWNKVVINTSVTGQTVCIIDNISEYMPDNSGSGGLDIEALKEFLLTNGYTALLDWFGADENNDIYVKNRKVTLQEEDENGEIVEVEKTIPRNFYSYGEVSAGGIGSSGNGNGGSGGGLSINVYGEEALGTITSKDKDSTFSAYAIDTIYKQVKDSLTKEVANTLYAPLVIKNYFDVNGNALNALTLGSNQEGAVRFKVEDIKNIKDAVDQIKTWFTLVDIGEDEDGVMQKALYTTYNLASEQEVSSGGIGSSDSGDGGSGGGLSINVYGEEALGTITSKDKNSTFSAYAIDSIYRLVQNINNGNAGYLTKEHADELYAPISIKTQVEDIVNRLKSIEDWFELTDGTLITQYNLASYGEVSSGGIGSGSSGDGGGNIGNILGVNKLGTIESEDLSQVFSAYAVDLIYKDVQNVINGNSNYLTPEKADLRYVSKDSFNALNEKFTTFYEGADVDGTINRWKELEYFLSGYTETAQLADLLINKADKSAVEDLKKDVDIIKSWFTLVDSDEDGVDDTLLCTQYNIASYGEVSSGGIGSGSSGDEGGSGNGVGNILPSTSLAAYGSTEKLTEVFSAYTTKLISDRVGVLEERNPINLSSMWGALTSSGSEKIDVSHIPDLSGVYLPKTGGTINPKSYLGLVLNSPDTALNQLQLRVNDEIKGIYQYNAIFGVGFHHEGKGGIYVSQGGLPIFVSPSLDKYTLYHSGNFSPADYLPLSGGTLSGKLTIKASGWPLIEFKAGGITRGYYGFSGTGIAAIWDTEVWHTLLHSGNIGDYAYSKSEADAKYVTLSTNQNITGYKEFHNTNFIQAVFKRTYGAGYGSAVQFRNNENIFGWIGWSKENDFRIVQTDTKLQITDAQFNVYSDIFNVYKNDWTPVLAISDSGVTAYCPISIPNSSYYYVTDSAGTKRHAITLNANNNLMIGNGTAEAGYPTYLYGSMIVFKKNTATELARLDENGLDLSERVINNVKSIKWYDSGNGYFIGARKDGLGTTDGGTLIYAYGDNPISFYTYGSERMKIYGDGLISFAGFTQHNAGLSSTAISTQSITIGGATLTWDAESECLIIDKNLAAYGEVSSGGMGDGSASGGNVNLLQSWSGEWDSSYALSAGLGVDLNNRLVALEANGGINLTSMWSALATDDSSKVIHSSHIPDLRDTYLYMPLYRPSSAGIDLNTFLTGGGKVFNYGSAALWQNAPAMSYGSVFQFNSYENNSDYLAVQLAFDINHRSTATTRGFWYRTRDDVSWANANWKRVLDDSNYGDYALPLSGGKLTKDNFLVLSIENTATDLSVIGFYGKSGLLGHLGFNAVNKPRFMNTDGVGYDIVHSGNIGSQSVSYATNAGNSAKVAGLSVNIGSRSSWGTIPAITDGGWMDVGKHFEFHYDNTTNVDYSTILACAGNYSNMVFLPSTSGTLALLTDNVASATKLQTARTIWGQSFDGTGDIINPAIMQYLIFSNSNGEESGYVGRGGNDDILFLRSYKNAAIHIGRNNYNDVIIKDGNVLIGTTTNNGAKLQVDGLIQAGNTTLGNVSIDLNRNANSGKIFDSSKIATEVEAYADYIGFKIYGADGSYKGTPLALTNSNVGIGTTSPAYKLDVAGTGRFTGALSVANTIYATTNIMIGDSNNFISSIGGHLSLDTNSDEICISGSNNDNLYVNYRASKSGYAPASWYWKAGTSTSWATFYLGALNATGHILPTATASYTLGNGTYRWYAAYLNTLNTGVAVVNETLSVAQESMFGGTATFNGVAKYNNDIDAKNIYPQSALGYYHLGSLNYRWDLIVGTNIYGNKFIGYVDGEDEITRSSTLKFNHTPAVYTKVDEVDVLVDREYRYWTCDDEWRGQSAAYKVFESGYSKSINTFGWYRVYVGKYGVGYGQPIRLTIATSYNTPMNESYVFEITNSCSGRFNITQVSGCLGGKCIDMIRCDYNINASVFYIDFHVGNLTPKVYEEDEITVKEYYAQTFFVSGTGDGDFQRPVKVSNFPSGAAYVFNVTNSGFKTDLTLAIGDGSFYWESSTNSLRTDNAIKIGNARIWWDEDNQCLIVDKNFASYGEVSSGGIGSGSSGDGGGSGSGGSITGGTLNGDLSITGKLTIAGITTMNSGFLSKSIQVGSIANDSIGFGNCSIDLYGALYLNNPTTGKYASFTISDTSEMVVINRALSVVSLTQTSDIRFKQVTEDVCLPSEVIANAPMFRFTWADGEDGKVHIGTSAQYWMTYTPELTALVDNKHTLDYATLGVLMGKSNATEIEQLKERVRVLEEEVKCYRRMLNAN